MGMAFPPTSALPDDFFESTYDSAFNHKFISNCAQKNKKLKRKNYMLMRVMINKSKG